MQLDFYNQFKHEFVAEKRIISLHTTVPGLIREIEYEDIVILEFTLDCIDETPCNRFRQFGQKVNHYQVFKNFEQNRISLL